MVQFLPERTVVTGKRSQAMLFDLIASGHEFDFDAMLKAWFDGRELHLMSFLEWLDEHGLEIRKKNV